MTNLLINFKVNKSLENKINEILFKEKKEKNNNKLIDALIYLHEIILKVRETDNIDSNIILVQFLSKHINKCNKINCNCKLLNDYMKKEISKENKKNEKENKKDLLMILNYLYESSFLEYNYYNINDLTILLAEHFCHLRDNPIMSFSIINSLITKNINNFAKFEIMGIYELCQKYIYYIESYEKLDKGFEIIENKNDNISSQKEKKEYYSNYYNSLRISIKSKILLNKYTNVLNKVLKFKNLFSESLTFKFDENNEYIDYVKINFFDQKSSLDNIENNEKNNKKESKKMPNLYNVIYLLKKEQLYFDNIINNIKKIAFFKDFPVFIIYKYYLFFDILCGHRVPQEISSKLYRLFSNKETHSNIYISNKIYNLLKIRYNEQNNKKNSKFFAMYEYKNDLSIKYFSEEFAIKLGYRQKDLINKKIDILMPKEFSKSHQNVVKKILIGDQLKFFKLNKTYVFDNTKTILYPVSPKGILIYDLSKNLIILSETIFLYENEYDFMLNHNFEILAITSNYEYEYLLNQQIFRLYDLKLLDILQIKPEKLLKKFENELKEINISKSIRQIKTDEYFIPQLFVKKGETNNGIFKLQNFNNSKNQILSNIFNSTSKFTDNENEPLTITEENKFLLKTQNTQNKIYEYFINPKNIVILHKVINFSLNKQKYIYNIFKELTKVPDLDILSEKDNNIHNLISDSKKLINRLITKNEFSNYNIKVNVKFNFYYDRPYYFISIYDEKKDYLRICKNLIFKNNDKNKQNKMSSATMNNIIQKISSEKNQSKTRNKKTKFKNTGINENKAFIENEKNKNNFVAEIEKENKIFNEIRKFRDEINKEKFILIIRILLIIIIIIIFIMYLLIIVFQSTSIQIAESNLLSFYYNTHIEATFYNILSKLNGMFFDFSEISPVVLSSSNNDKVKELAIELRNNYHYFSKYFKDYNLKLGKSFDIIYSNSMYFEIKGFWKEIEFSSKYSTEIEYLIYLLYLINDEDFESSDFKTDVNNFLFYLVRSSEKVKVYSHFIRVLFYMTINYEFSFQRTFDSINNEIYKSYKNYINQCNERFYFLEVSGLIFYIIFFFTTLIYLYNSNIIIIKNIIFLFLDFSEENFNKNNNFNDNIIIIKILRFKNLIEDFDLNGLQNYFQDIDNINIKNYIKSGQEMEKILDEKTKNNFPKKHSINKNNKENNKRESLEEKIYNKENNSSQKNLPQVNAYNNNNNKKLQSNNSSYNYLVGSDSNFFKNNLNSNSLTNSQYSGNINNSNKSLISNSFTNSLSEKNIPKNIKSDLEIKDNFQDAILNRSNQKIISFIKKYIIIIFILAIIIIIYNIFLMLNNIDYTKQSIYYIDDFKIISSRFIKLYVYFNTLKSLIMFNEKDFRWNLFCKNLENMNNYLQQSNTEYNSILSHIQKVKSYNEVKELIILFGYNKNDTKDYLKEKICLSSDSCLSYLDSEDNIFSSGIDSTYNIIFIYINNIFNDYKKLENKTNLEEIQLKITGDNLYEFKRLRKSFSYAFYNIQEAIYSSFENDEIKFRDRYLKEINILNYICILFSIIICLFTFFSIFISIRNFVNPIKKSVFKINQSFYYIKTYSRTNNLKKDYSFLN